MVHIIQKCMELTLNARVASTSSDDFFLLLLWLNEGSLGFGRTGLWRNSLSCTVDNLAVLHESLDQPVVCSVA
jgi:hypothetical protein